MVLLRPALRSTAFGGGLSYGGPSIPLPQACCLEPNTARPGPGGGFGGVVGMGVCAAKLTELWHRGGNDFSAQALNAPCSGPLGPPRHADVKRGSRSRAGQSAAKPWSEALAGAGP